MQCNVWPGAEDWSWNINQMAGVTHWQHLYPWTHHYNNHISYDPILSIWSAAEISFVHHSMGGRTFHQLLTVSGRLGIKPEKAANMWIIPQSLSETWEHTWETFRQTAKHFLSHHQQTDHVVVNFERRAWCLQTWTYSENGYNETDGPRLCNHQVYNCWQRICWFDLPAQ